MLFLQARTVGNPKRNSMEMNSDINKLIKSTNIEVMEDPRSIDTSNSSDCESKYARLSPVQITSIDGFFNRKRGRPPKNRFVEVYKRAQLSPQAIFTSFKLDKSDYGNTDSSELTTTSKETSNRVLYDHNLPNLFKPSLIPTTLLNNVMATTDNSSITTTKAITSTKIETTAEAELFLSQPNSKYRRMRQHEETAFKTTTTTTSTTTMRKKSILEKNAQSSGQTELDNYFRKNELCTSEKISVVRAAGTFYPQHSSRSDSIKIHDEVITPPNPRYLIKEHIEAFLSTNNSEDQPEDLSMKVKTTESHKVAAETASESTNHVDCIEFVTESNLKVLQLKQFFNLYQQQQPLIPNYEQSLVAGVACQTSAGYETAPIPSSSNVSDLSVNMSVFFENTVKQKLFLLNMAAAAAAAASATGNTNVVAKSDKTISNSMRNIRDHNIPTGYLKFRFNEDCCFEQCSYRNHQSHFHCNRNDCYYSFCDKTRFVQHTARHDRLDTLMGDDFQQYRANMRCGYVDCSYGNLTHTIQDQDAVSPPAAGLRQMSVTKKSSHFHCQKCDYVCADTNKVVAHRRLHSKMEFIHSAGFRKVASNETCLDGDCLYALKQTHYHCLTCTSSVLSRAQLAAHKHKIPLFAGISEHIELSE